MPYEDEIPPYAEPDVEMNALTHAVIGAAMEVHKRLGPGLDESLYDQALRAEFDERGIAYVAQPIVQVEYKGRTIGEKRLDFIVGGRLVVEIKAVERLAPIHSAQVKTYLKSTKLSLGLLINFNDYPLKDGIKRIINSSTV